MAILKSPGVHYCLPKRLARLTIKRGLDAPSAPPAKEKKGGPPPGFKDDIELQLLPPVSDGTCFTAQLNHSWWTSDEVALKTTSTGILSSVNIASDDRRGEVLLTLAKVVIRIAQVVAAPPTALVSMFGKGGEEAKPCTPPIRGHWEFAFDPSNNGEVVRVQNQLVQACLNYQLSSVRQAAAPSPSAAGTTAAGGNAEGAENSTLAEANGLYYRRPTAFRIALATTVADRAGNTAAIPVFQTLATVPNGGPIVRADITGSWMVRTTYAATFDGGVLTEVKATKPSESLAWATLPLSLLNLLGESVGNFFQIKVDYSSKHEDVVQAQQAVIEQQRMQLQANADAKAQAAQKPETVAVPLP